MGYHLGTIVMRIILILSLLFGLVGCFSKRFPVLPKDRSMSSRELEKLQAHSHFVKARDYERRGLSLMAQQFYEKAYELDSNSKILRSILIKRYLASQKYLKALTLIKGDKKTTELSDRDKRVVANIYVLLQRYSQAAKAMESILEKKLSDRCSLGFIYEHTENIDKAISNYTVCYEKNLSNVKVGMKLAQLYIRAKEYVKAESLYVVLNNQFSDNAEILNSLGLVNALQNDTAAALKFYTEAVNIDTNHVEAMGNIAQIYIERGDYTEAISWYKKMAISDTITRYYHERTIGLLYFYNKEYEKAAELFNSLLPTQNDDYEIHYYLGLIYAADEKFELAETSFLRAIELKKDFVDAWVRLCYLQVRQKDKEQALHYAQLFIESLPESSESWHMLGSVYNVRKEYDEAIRTLRKALEFNEKNPNIWFELGGAYERSGKYSKAAESFGVVLSLNPEDDLAANYLGYMWADQNKNLDSAKTLLEFALKNDPNNGAYLDSYGWIFYRKGDYEKAQLYIEKALEQMDDDPIIYEHLGDIFFKRNELSEAIKAYEESINRKSENEAQLKEKINSIRKMLQNSSTEKNSP